ncbi:hypothetical protein J437_LFUL000765 [Ladona fulva]|uniref:Fork-head domain-containing protein n=1 Tax=Ladona fulva TaxID=123851 RepID=A0A8K0KR84_LADFU|nr:hypothetical protein J437_LFUL000765 [Ladona fulva]
MSLHNRFMRVQNEGTGKSSWWMINPDAKPGKSARRRAASMETSKFEKRRGRARKKAEAIRTAAAAASSAPQEHHGGQTHHQPHHTIIHSGGQPATPSPASSISESLDLFIESPPPPIPIQGPGTPAASPFGPPDFRPRASSNASSCGGRLSPIPALDSDSSPLPTRWENGEYSPYDRYATEQLAGNLAEGMKIEEAYLQMRHNGFGEQQSPGSPFPPPPPPPPAYEAYHHHAHHHQHHQRHQIGGHMGHLPMRHGGRQEVEMVPYHGMGPGGCPIHPHQQCGCPRPMEAASVDGSMQGHCEAMSPGLSPSQLGQSGGYSPTEGNASVPPPPPLPPPPPPATSASCTSPPAGTIASPASASSPSAPASSALLAASRSPAAPVSPSASPATGSVGLPAPSPSEDRDVEERRRGGVRGGMRGGHHAGSRTPTPSQMMSQLIGVLNNNSRNNNNNEEYLSQQHQPHYNYQVYTKIFIVGSAVNDRRHLP